VSAVAAQYQVSRPVAHRQYAVHADAVLIEREPPVVRGIDETRRGTPKWIQDPETGIARASQGRTPNTRPIGPARAMDRSRVLAT
jgi:hypothetical protein